MQSENISSYAQLPDFFHPQSVCDKCEKRHGYFWQTKFIYFNKIRKVSTRFHVIASK